MSFVAILGKWHSAVFCLLLAVMSSQTMGAGLNHRVSENHGGIYRYYDAPPTALLLFSLGGAAYLGSEDRLGKTLWQNTEGYLVDQAATELLKRTAGRLRPTETGDPNQWRKISVLP